METIELRERLRVATPIDFAGVIVNRMPRDIDTAAMSASLRGRDDVRKSLAVADWLAERRKSAIANVSRLADAFELGSVETISEAGVGVSAPVDVTSHVAAELGRLLEEHQ